MRDISMHILDIAQNSISANADIICIIVDVNNIGDLLRITISDDGIGMSKELLTRVTSPFATTRTTRNIGLGIPLFAASCERTGKRLSLESEQGVGTKLTADYCLSHIDRPPIGDLTETIHTLIMLNPDINFVFTIRAQDEFVFDTREIKQRLGGVPINNGEVLEFLKEYLSEGITGIIGGIDI